MPKIETEHPCSTNVLDRMVQDVVTRTQYAALGRRVTLPRMHATARVPHAKEGPLDKIMREHYEKVCRVG